MASSAYSYILSIFRNSHSFSLEMLDVEQVCLLLHTLEKSELKKLKKELDNETWQFISMVDKEYLINYIENMVPAPARQQPQRNESIGKLLKLFCDKKSGRVQERK